jgi:imidazolonepropionase-like amidohydrolase
MLRAGALLDVDSGELRQHPVVVVRGNTITAVSFGTTETPPGAEVIDLGDAVLMPGLIDAHVHLAWAPREGDVLVQPGITRQAADDARATLFAGFTTVRNLGSTNGADLLLRDAIARGEIVGPTILAAGAGLGSPGGACDLVFGGEAVASDAAGFAMRAEQVITAGADVVKVCTGGGVIAEDAKASPDLTVEHVRAIVAASNARGRKVAAHAQGTAAIEVAIDGGVASIEHGGFISSNLADKMQRLGVWLVPTLYRLEFTEAASGEAQRQHFAAAVRAGVPVAFGTDAPVIPHGTNAREFDVLVRLGLSPLDAVRAATTNAAALLGRPDIGSLATGSRADIIAAAGHPLRDVGELEHITYVMCGGRTCVRPDA